MNLSKRSKLLEPSATLAINALAKERAKQGLAVFNLSTGEPDFETPENVKAAAIKAIKDGMTRYTAVGGIPELKKAIQKKYLNELGVDFETSAITCSNGGKQILYNLFQVILNEGDEVLCFSPYWVSYKTQVELAGGVLKEINLPAEENFCFRLDLLEAACTERTKAILINSPGNPTGQVLSENDLQEIARIARQKDLLVISDDVYEYFYYSEKKPVHLLQVAPDLKEQTIVVNAVSKTYAMTGWRLGFAAGNKQIIAKMEELQSHSSSNPSSISQMAALEALIGPQENVEIMRQTFLERRNILMEKLEGMQNRLPGFGYIKPAGAFYLMIKIAAKKLPGETDLQFCLDLLEKTGAAVTPGASFGKAAEGWVRISFATALETVVNGLELVEQFRTK
jgi:aspartate aminotransferase